MIESASNSCEKGSFNVGHDELDWIIVALLQQATRRKCAVRTLFQKVLNQLHRKPRGKTREKLFREFALHLKQLKEQRKIEFISGKTKVYVHLQ